MSHPMPLYPDQEPARKQALDDLGILDTPPEERFEALCAEAQQALGAPAAYISFLTEERQWFKATVGMGDHKETPRQGTFCDYAIRKSRPTVVLDASRDPLFAQSPYVTGFPNVRFYAGHPLTVKGQRVGTLCTLDFAPREGITKDQQEQLAALARRAERELDPTVYVHTAEGPREFPDPAAATEFAILETTRAGISARPADAARLFREAGDGEHLTDLTVVEALGERLRTEAHPRGYRVEGLLV